MKSEPQSKEFIQGLARGLEVIRAFGTTRPQMTLTDVARETGFSRASARRCLLTLQELGYVRSDGRLFALTPRILSLGFGFLSSQGISTRIHPILKQASQDLGEAVALAMPEDDVMVCVAHAPGEQRILTIGLTVGSRMPLLTTAIGRAYLAFLPDDERDALVATAPVEAHTQATITDRAQLRLSLEQIRHAGHAIVDEEFEDGVRSIGVPVVKPDGTCVGALNVIVSSSRTSLDDLVAVHLPVIERCADAVSQALL